MTRPPSLRGTGTWQIFSIVFVVLVLIIMALILMG